MRKLLTSLLFFTSLYVPLAFAQDDASQAGIAQNEVRISAMEEELRALRGKIEETEFQNRKLTQIIEKLQKDIDFRFNEIAQHPATSGAATPASTQETKKIEITHERKPLNITPDENTDNNNQEMPDGAVTSAGNGVLQLPEQAAEGNEFSNPRDHYNHAFRLLNQTQYEEAAASFDSFTKKYPKDPLIGNAYYWLGETYYIRRDYVTAADAFRQGFEALPNGPKAADNLLKLAMSLDALKRDKEACVVLKQVAIKFNKSSASVAQKAAQEQQRIGCK